MRALRSVAVLDHLHPAKDHSGTTDRWKASQMTPAKRHFVRLLAVMALLCAFGITAGPAQAVELGGPSPQSGPQQQLAALADRAAALGAADSRYAGLWVDPKAGTVTVYRVGG